MANAGAEVSLAEFMATLPTKRVRPAKAKVSARRPRRKSRKAPRPAHCRDVEGIETLALDPCAYCGERAGTHDHVEPISRGGSHDLANLVRCCWRCNREKNTRRLLVFLALRAQRRAA